jgi:hypothetical protein
MGGPEEGRQEFVFARKASGLVRGLSLFDSMAVGLMNTGITANIWGVITLGLATYLGANLIITCIVSIILAGIGFPLVWGMLAGSMPRSGGEYVYNSRIIHPIVGIAENFGNAFVMIFWIYVLAPWVADPGLVLVAQYMDWTWLYDNETGMFFGGSLGYETGTFVVASLANVAGFLCTAFGLKILVTVQRIAMGIGLFGAAVMCVALSSVNKETFIANWNEFAARYDSLDYASFVDAVSKAAGTAIPTTWNWYDSIAAMGAASWLFAYAYFLVYVAVTRCRSCPTSCRSPTSRGRTGSSPSRCRSRSWRSASGGSRSPTWASRACSSPGASTASGRAGSPTSTRASRAR